MYILPPSVIAMDQLAECLKRLDPFIGVRESEALRVRRDREARNLSILDIE